MPGTIPITRIVLLVAPAALLAVAAIAGRARNAREARRAAEIYRRIGRTGRLPVLMPVCGRPHYLRRVLDSLSRARGIDRTVLVISQDGNDPEVGALVQGIGFTEVIHIRHARPFLGIPAYFWDGYHAVSSNIRFLLDLALLRCGAPGAIVLEDDLVVGPDALDFFEWAFREILPDPGALSVTGFNLHSRPCPEGGWHPRNHPLELVVDRGEASRPKFTGWSWAIARDQWLRVRGEWSPLRWDLALTGILRRRGLVSWKPVLARTRNIGMQGGINFTEAEENPKWADVFLSEGDADYGAPPVRRERDPFVPAHVDARPARRPRNERSRTRLRRLALGLGLAAALAAEWILR
jgi:hypothetical protein